MDSHPDHEALLPALRLLLQPLARLALARGLPYAALDGLLRTALVEEACRMQPDAPRHGRVSRISTATGLARREVSRLLAEEARPALHRRGLAAEVFARWMTDPGYLQGSAPRVLPRQGEAPSFEALAQSVTRDVHPRTLLDELCRLELAAWDPDTDTVALRRDAFVPHADVVQMLELLGNNVGDHLQAAVANVLGGGDLHFEQAVFADELSADSMRALRPLIAAQWTALFSALAPALEQHIAADEQAGRTQDQRVRIGFYSYAAPMEGAASTSGPDSAGPVVGERKGAP